MANFPIDTVKEWVYIKNMETMKTFKRLGNIVGLQVTRKSQRGIVGKRFSTLYDKWFQKRMVRITPKTLKVNSIEGTYYL